MPDTPSTKHGLARPADTDFINTWPSTARTMIDLVDTLMATAITTTPRPAAGKFGRIHRAADGTISFDTGTTWEELGRMSVIQADVIPALPPVGALLATAAASAPPGGKWQMADGGLISAASFPAFMTEVGHAYNLGVDPGGGQVRKPDKRGRVMVGADDMGTGAAGRLPNTNRARGQSHGEERHAQTVAEMAVHAHADTIAYAAAGAHGHAITVASSPVIDPGSYVIPYNGGVTNVTVQGIAGGFNSPAGSFGYGSSSMPHVHGASSGTEPAHSHSKSGGVSNNGSGTPFNVMQPGQVDNVIVRVA